MTDVTEVKNRVYQSNKLIESSYTLTLQEKRLVMLAASILHSKHEPPRDGIVKVSAEAFASVFGVEVKHAYGILAEAIERLWPRDIKRFEGGTEVETMRWIYKKKYLEGEGAVEIGFSPSILPHLTLLTTEFTSYRLKHISNLTSLYAFRIYELSTQYKKFGVRTFDLTRLRELLNLENKYPNVKDLRRYVLDPCIEEISQHTDLGLSLEAQRTGRKITGFKIYIEQSEQLPLGL
ncbi:MULTISPECIES: replication initiation protein [Pseudomonas]|uniref:Replication protein n=1 Tax=Pseudomonas syringae pv. actinidiae TaxID=103796 RepID=A0A2P0QFA6_PSESF|nr:MULTISPECIES: replication initiation protein [Pseudomonas]APQ06976.1 replication initiator protein [Pseudomonas syringae pv. actinidiae]ARO44956.1 Replication protein [Pseudomonas syringae pv. actinidiae]ARO45061.1 Replication protein [Pseudomonas syringae pv. actinidiae]ARO45152.1 Replication protein [Pseudomonas syringae pv. actinidiae]ARO45193.1 Replication protein [Pseudomonas syringae pv. actinidiae]